MMMDDDKLNTWKVDDLDSDLSSGLSNLNGLDGGTNGLDSGTQEQLLQDHLNMTEVLQLQMFKEETLESSDLLQSLDNSLQESLNKVTIESGYSFAQLQNDHAMETVHTPLSMNHVTTFNDGKFIIRELEQKPTPIECAMTLKAPTAPGIRLGEETLTWLNQGQPYEIILQAVNKDKFLQGTFIKSIVSIGFQERQHQYFEYEKYDEWVSNRPAEKMIELDIPMCFGLYNPTHSGTYSNEIEFQWDPSAEARLFVKVNCLSSEFTKGKGESGVPLRLQIEVFPLSVDTQVTDDSIYASGCQVKVFRAKGANRKLKLGREKHESLSKEEAEKSTLQDVDVKNQVQKGHLQESQDFTVFKKLDNNERIRRKSFDTPTKLEMPPSAGVSPTQLNQLEHVSSNNSLVEYTQTTSDQNLSANSTVDETQAWLRYNRFHNYAKCFANFTGADLLRMSRSDFIQLCGPADGIRLNNCLQARSSRPLLTMYVSPEWHQSESGMREYHAMFLEQLTVEDLKRKLAKKCNLKEHEIITILKQGPTGIHIHVDDEVVRNFVEEAHHVVEVLKDPANGYSRILLK